MKLDLFASDIRNKIEVPMVSSDESADQLQQRESSPSDVTVSQEIHDTKVHSSKTEEARSITSAATKNEVKDSEGPACALQSEQEGNTCSLRLEKPLQSPDTLLRPLQAGQDSPSVIREKVSKDGYNWRKYGQKHVKGNEFIRSYYKCTHPTCQAKKQLEQSNNGQITDTVCIGQHNHPRPQLNTTLPVDCVPPVVEEKPDKPSSVNVEDKASVEHGCVPQQIKPLDLIQISKVSTSDEAKAALLQLARAKDEVHNNDYTEPKRLKKDNNNANVTGVDKSSCESRVVVRTSSEVDFVNDGYRWRKYGQKLVKGNPNPRSYYRCSSPGCPVKKHMERASHDSKIVITTYEGQHDHESPPERTVTHNAATITDTMVLNCMPGTKAGGDTVCVDTGEHNRLDSEGRLNEQLNGESRLKAGDTVEFRVVTNRSEGPESKLSEEEQQNGNSGTKKDSASIDIICPLSSEVPGISNKQLKDEVKTKSEGNKDCLRVVTVHDTPDLESKFSKQSTPDAEPVQS